MKIRPNAYLLLPIAAFLFATLAGCNKPSPPTDFISKQRRLAEKGDAEAAYFLGLDYFSSNTNHVEKEYVEAFKWFLKSADHNCPAGQYSVGECYFFGYGVQKDYAEAVRWYRKAAEQGDRHGQYQLGACYEMGKGVQKDEVEACKWYSIAVANGLGNARKNLTNIERNIRPEQIAEVKRRANEFRPHKLYDRVNFSIPLHE